jgi:iron(III) transport system substrate-binding protein
MKKFVAFSMLFAMLAVAVVAYTPVATAAPAADYNAIIEGSKKENALLIYSIMGANNWKFLLNAFNQKYPWIKVDNVELGGYEVFQRYYSEIAGKAKTCDMVITTAPDAWQDFIAKGELAVYRSTEDGKVPDWSKPAPGVYTVASDPIVMIWNKQSLPGSIKSTAELAAMIEKNPAKFEKKIATVNIEVNSTGFAANWFYIKRNGEAGWKVLEAIGKAKPNLHTSNGTVVNDTISGAATASFLVSGMNVFAKLPAAESVMGNSLTSDGTPVTLRSMGITKAAKNSNSAKLMLDFILSPEGQIKFSEGGLTAYRSDVIDKAKLHLSKLAASIGEKNLLPFYFDKELLDKAKTDAFTARWKKAMGK